MKRKKSARPEGILQLQILKYIKFLGFPCGKTKTMGLRQARGTFRFDPYVFRGFPDLTAFVPHLMFIEVKSPKGVQSESQKDFQGFCKRANIKYILARNLEDVTKELNVLM